jgi:hypothetical protein
LKEGNVVLAFFSSGCNQSNLSTQLRQNYKFLFTVCDLRFMILALEMDDDGYLVFGIGYLLVGIGSDV